MLCTIKLIKSGTAGQSSLEVDSVRENAHIDGYLKDVLSRLPTLRASEITELLPHKRALV